MTAITGSLPHPQDEQGRANRAAPAAKALSREPDPGDAAPVPDESAHCLELAFQLTWRGVEVRGVYHATPFCNRRDRVYLNADVPLFADGAQYLVTWFGPICAPDDPALFAEMAECWLDEAAAERGLHPDDMIRYRQISLF